MQSESGGGGAAEGGREGAHVNCQSTTSGKEAKKESVVVQSRAEPAAGVTLSR